MNWQKELIFISIGTAVFLVFYFLPAGNRFLSALSQGACFFTIMRGRT